MFDANVLAYDSFGYLLGYALLKYLPLAVLCCLPFLGSLRMERRRFHLLFCVTVPAACVGLALCYKFLGWPADAGMLVFALLGLLVMQAAVRAGFFKLLFVFLVVMHYGSLHHDFTYFVQMALGWPESTNLAAFPIAYLITAPLLALVLVKSVRPAVENDVQAGVWRVVWVIPVAFFAAQFGINTGYMQLPQEVLATTGLTIGAYASYYFIFKIIDEMARNAALSESIRTTDKILTMQAAQYETLMKRLDEQRRARHDARHHQRTMAGLLARGQYDELGAYLEQYATSLPDAAEVAYCENAAANALAAHYLERAKLAGAEVDAVLDIPAGIGIPEADLAVVLGNLFENAAEAAERMGGGHIRARAQTLGDVFVLTMDNSFGDAPITRDGEFLSCKREGPGMGIASVRAVAQRHDGEARFEVMGNTFQASVRLTERREGDA